MPRLTLHQRVSWEKENPDKARNIKVRIESSEIECLNPGVSLLESSRMRGSEPRRVCPEYHADYGIDTTEEPVWSWIAPHPGL